MNPGYKMRKDREYNNLVSVFTLRRQAHSFARLGHEQIPRLHRPREPVTESDTTEVVGEGKTTVASGSAAQSLVHALVVLQRLLGIELENVLRDGAGVTVGLQHLLLLVPFDDVPDGEDVGVGGHLESRMDFDEAGLGPVVMSTKSAGTDFPLRVVTSGPVLGGKAPAPVLVKS